MRTIITLCLVSVAGIAIGENLSYYRIVSETNSVIVDFASPGYLTWSNATASGTVSVQVAQSLTNDWRDYTTIVLTSAQAHAASRGIGPDGMCFVPYGFFWRGDSLGEGNVDEWGMAFVYVDSFMMDGTEVTKAEWDSVYTWATNAGYSFENPGSFAGGVDYSKGSGHPVHFVNWYDCAKWCNARSEMESFQPCYYADTSHSSIFRTGRVDLTVSHVDWLAAGYRLPTEAEWERAARGGPQKLRYPWWHTNRISHLLANYFSTNHYIVSNFPYNDGPTHGYHPAFTNGGLPYTSPAGYFPGTGYGLQDMAGNVSEWCWDWYDAEWYTNAPSRFPNSSGPTSGTERVIRGGNYSSMPDNERCAHRLQKRTPDSIRAYVGFRCIRRDSLQQ